MITLGWALTLVSVMIGNGITALWSYETGFAKGHRIGDVTGWDRCYREYVVVREMNRSGDELQK